jgi:hypothetical protein
MTQISKDESRPCVCGHEFGDHHVSWLNTGQTLAEECENAECERAPWQDRCMHYRPSEGEVRGVTLIRESDT